MCCRNDVEKPILFVVFVVLNFFLINSLFTEKHDERDLSKLEKIL